MSGELNETAGLSLDAAAPLPGAWRTVAIFTLIYGFGTLDRQIAALLVPHIKHDLNLSDLQVSMIQGLAFGLFFMAASPVVGWLVDRMSRRKVLFVGLATWSLGGIASGLSRTFGQLFGARATVGAFEATINPSAYSLFSDLFPPRKLALPLSIFVLGGNLGSAISFVVGGAVIAWAASTVTSLPVLGELRGWQLAFIVTGLPGFLLSPIVFLAAEPARHTGRAAGVDKLTISHTGFGDLWAYARNHKSFYAGLLLGIGTIMSFVVGLQSWNATYLSRHFGWDLAQIGYVLGWTQLASALVGLALHGWIVDRLFARGLGNVHPMYMALMCALAVPCGIGAYFATNAWTMVVLYNLAYFFVMGFSSIGPAALQIATPVALRGKASAVYMIVLSILASILAPIIVATFTDVLFQDEAKLGYSMALFAGLTAVLSSVLLVWAGRGAHAAISDATRTNASVFVA